MMLGLKIKVSDNSRVNTTTHFQLKNTFESHALRKFILRRLNIKSKKKISLQFSIYIVKQEKTKLPKTIALILVKYFFIEEKINILTVYPQVN